MVNWFKIAQLAFKKDQNTIRVLVYHIFLDFNDLNVWPADGYVINVYKHDTLIQYWAKFGQRHRR